ncbi:MAG: tetratricopeptide repeat protein, partial [Bacteroidia bacterium]|nr:tetratricopeptide repeat protein [Bacteroidia bacterium]
MHSQNEFDDRRVETHAVRFEASLRDNRPIYFDAQTVLEVFDYFMQKGKTDVAYRLIEYGVETHSHEPAMWCRRALALMELDRCTEAFVCIERTLEAFPEEPEIWEVRAQILERTGNDEQAIETLKRGLIFLGPCGSLEFRLGMIYQMRGMYDSALTHLVAALEHGGPEEVYGELILCHEQLGRMNDCLALLEKHADRFPFDAAAWYHLGLALTKDERYEAAVEAYLNAIALEEDNFAHHYALALAYVGMNEYARAIPPLLDAHLLCPEEKNILMLLGECYARLEQPATARIYFQRCQKHHPEFAEAWYGIGSTFESEGKYLQAVYYYEKALELDENFYDAMLALAACEYELGNEYSAGQALEKAIAYMPQDICLWDEWSERLESDGRLDEAYLFVKRGLLHNPTSAELAYRLAALSFKLKRMAEAAAAFESGLLINYDGHEQFFQSCPEAADKPLFRALVAR